MKICSLEEDQAERFFMGVLIEEVDIFFRLENPLEFMGGDRHTSVVSHYHRTRVLIQAE